MSDQDRQYLIRLARIAVANFNAGDWKELGVHLGALDVITGHDRLLRSLSFADPDYLGHAHGVLFSLAERNPPRRRLLNCRATCCSAGTTDPASGGSLTRPAEII